jgi:putative IMPACT (imprinted ancient) family translation regulator
LERSSDDGEPGGTAGKPILNQIKSAKLTEVLVAIIRYYGGTKLGVSGLIDAYKNAARLALEASGVEECEVEVQYVLEVSHEETPALMNALNRLSFRKIKTKVELDFTIEISIKEEMETQLLSVLKDLRLNSLKAENLAKHLSQNLPPDLRSNR